MLTRCWIALAALGAGLVHVAVGAGSPLVLLIPLVALGAAELGWAVATFARDRVPLPWAGFGLLLAPVIGWALVLTAGVLSRGAAFSGLLPVFPMASASLLCIVGAALLAIVLRQGDAAADEARTPRASAPHGVGRFLAGIAIGSFAVAAIVTPALAATQAGEDAVPHGEYGSHH